jgi:hypothetical protein
MPIRALSLVFALELTGALGIEGAPPEVAGPPVLRLEEPGPPGATCTRFWAQALYDVGYQHLVYVTNDCEFVISCVVWTNVNPVPQAASLAPEQSVVFVTFRGSPASTFTPFVRCIAGPPGNEPGASR